MTKTITQYDMRGKNIYVCKKRDNKMKVKVLPSEGTQMSVLGRLSPARRAAAQAGPQLSWTSSSSGRPSADPAAVWGA